MMAAGAALALALWLLLPVGVGGAGPPPIQDGEFTFLLPAGRKQCFYQSAPANASLETEYQVAGPAVRCVCMSFFQGGAHGGRGLQAVL
uniref:Transmembrane p24 trafficking protein 1 n=1 Tax=Suricata suricatta TaxID=37032 RepID=A0A673VAD3_SURSU